MSEYVIKIKWDDIKMDEKTPIEKSKSEAPTLKESKNKSNDMMSTLRTTATIYAFGRQAGQMAVNYQSQNYRLAGENRKADMLNTTWSNVSNNVGLGLGVGMSILTGNPIAIGLTAYALAQRAFNLALETRNYQSNQQLERYRSQYYSDRLVKSISEVR